ncbi:S41 family peptidase [candidate division WOR-3 bacterium]|uniref:S41 family peptidase n=1 Tax=candidate division WOR-3 bacterium TaxID=2052148 RepID=A0A937XG23_UNCW3|nr:S41 family peptidase [candidate division WOR-3 bacterium]
MKRRVALVTTLVVLSLCLGGLFGRLWAQKTGGLLQSLQTFSRVVDIVMSTYVERIDPDKMIRSGIRGMLGSLDPHTEFLDERDFKELRVMTEGQFGGIGIHIGMMDQQLTVISPIEGTPAERAGIRGGDRIAEIDGKSTVDFTTDDAIKVLRGEPGSKVKLGISRPGVRELIPFELIRAIINIKAVPYAALLDDGIGFVRLADFSKTATQELRRAIDSLFAAGATKLIFDLRSNGGGLLGEGRDVTDLFLPPGKVIVRTKGRIPDSKRDYVSETQDVHGGEFPLVVLVDRASASASEIVAGALQDWERGLIVGDTTYGKGSVQTIHPLGPEIAVKVTTAFWYTPSGRCINRLHDKESAIIQDTVQDTTKAYYTLGCLHRRVYGRGGIAPDVYAAYPRLSPLAVRMTRDAYFDFAVDYANSHAGLTADFRADRAVLEQFREYLRTTKKVEFTPVEFDSSSAIFVREIEREVAAKLLGMRGDYQARLRSDEHVKKAVELLRPVQSLAELLKGLN